MHSVLCCRNAFMAARSTNWIENKNFDKKKLPACQYPAWLGLPNNAEKVLLTTQLFRHRSASQLKATISLRIYWRCNCSKMMTTMKMIRLPLSAAMAAPHGCTLCWNLLGIGWVYCRTHWLRCDRLSKSSKQIHKTINIDTIQKPTKVYINIKNLPWIKSVTRSIRHRQPLLQYCVVNQLEFSSLNDCMFVDQWLFYLQLALRHQQDLSVACKVIWHDWTLT